MSRLDAAIAAANRCPKMRRWWFREVRRFAERLCGETRGRFLRNVAAVALADRSPGALLDAQVDAEYPGLSALAKGPIL